MNHIKRRFTILYSLTLLWSPLFSQDALSESSNQTIISGSISNLDDIQKFYSHYRDVLERSEGESTSRRLLREETHERDRRMNQLCVHCPEIDRLVSSVNDILQKVAEESRSTHPFLYQEVKGLEGMYYLTMSQAWEPNTNDLIWRCYQVSLAPRLDKNVEQEFREEDAVLIFDEHIDLNRISSMTFRGNNITNYFFRGTGPDKNLIIRVDVDRDGNARVRYYRLIDKQLELDDFFRLGFIQRDEDGQLEMRNTPHSKDHLSIKYNKHQVEREKDFSDEGSAQTDALREDEWGTMRSFQTEGERGGTQAELGFTIQHSSSIPRGLRILDFSSKHKITENVRIQHQAEISTSRQELRIALSDSQDNPYLEVKTRDGKDVELRVPYSIGVGESTFELRGDIRARSREKELGLAIVSMDNEYARITLREEGSETSYSIVHEREINQGRSGTLSIRFERESKSTTERGRDFIWLDYQVRF